MATAAPSLDTQPLKPRFMRVPLDHLQPSPNNPRKIKDGDPSLKELAESLRTLGQIEPIVVQELPDDPERFEILAGERRWRAAKLAGLEEIEAKVMAVDEQQALEITVVENLQRVDLDPLSEARGVATLLSKGWDVATIAAHLGKGERWVHLRAGLTKLTTEWTEAIAKDGSLASRFTAGHLELIARLTPEQQAIALHKIDDMAREWDGTVVTVGELADSLASQFTRDLSAARWDCDDADLVPKAGACSACPKRSSCQQQIFADLNTGKKKADHCLDDQCWSKKETAWLKAQEKAAKEQHGDDLVKINPEKYYGTGKALGENEYTKVKAGTKGAKPALIVAGADAGQTVWVKPKDSGRASQPRTPEDDAKEEAKRKREEIARQRADHIGELIQAAMSPKKAKVPDDETLIRMAGVLLQDWNQRSYRAFDPKVKTDTLRADLWAKICQEFEVTGSEKPLCELLGLDHTALVAAAAAKFTDPSEGVVEAKEPKPEKAKAKPAKKATTKKIAKKAKKKGAA
jgi:ParB/RepB/Spo0J family partition protein